MLSEEKLQDLESFVECVESLERTRFVETFLSQSEIITHGTDRADSWRIEGFDEEHMCAFLLSLRKLVQNNDPCSFYNIWSIFKDDIKDRNWFARANPPRWMLNDLLDQGSILSVPEVESATNRVIFETFLYGLYAHSDREKRELLKVWRQTNQFIFLKQSFLMILKCVYGCAKSMKSVAMDYLKQQEAER